MACLSNMRQLGQSLVMFTQEHKGFLPKGWFNARAYVTQPTNGRDVQPADYSSFDSWGFRYPMFGWDYVLLKYAGNSKAVFQCPSDTDPEYRGLWDNPPNNGFTDATLPDKPEADDIPGSYRINLSDLANQQFDAVKIGQIRKPAQAIVIVEGARKAANRLAIDGPYHHVATWESDPEGCVGPVTKKNIAWDRHAGKRSNYVFADGHAESLDYKETWKPIGPQVWPGNTVLYRQATMWRQRYDVPQRANPPRTTPYPEATP